MCKDFERWFLGQISTFSHILATPGHITYHTHKRLVLMIWLTMKVLFTCLDLCAICNGRCSFHSTYSRAGRVTWIRVVFADWQRTIVNEWLKVRNHLRYDLCTGCLFFTIFQRTNQRIDVCSDLTAHSLVLRWILDEEVMFYARIVS